MRAAARCTTWHDEERLFGDAVAAGSPSPRVWYNYGNTLLQRGAEVAAAEAYAGAAERAPHDPAIWSNLGVAYQRQRAYAAAERAYRRAAELAPGDAQIYENLGILFVARGDLPAAREAFATAVRLDPQRSTSRRALAALQEHDHEGERRWRKRALWRDSGRNGGRDKCVVADNGGARGQAPRLGSTVIAPCRRA